MTIRRNRDRFPRITPPGVEDYVTLMREHHRPVPLAPPPEPGQSDEAIMLRVTLGQMLGILGFCMLVGADLALIFIWLTDGAL